MKKLKELVRPNIWAMKPYSSARDEFQGEASTFLDANENPWNGPYNRYPDPLQRKLKAKISELKDIDPEMIFIGNGSDEPIDLLIRAFCEPGIDNILTIDPSYGMYQVAADTSNVECRKVTLDEDFALNADKVLNAADMNTKLIFLCSPNNPSGNLLDRVEVFRILKHFDGLVVIDEAYIDFASAPSYLTGIVSYPNMVILQTLSKAWGAAGIRLGMAFASTEIISILNKIKYPYNINQLTQEYALKVLSDKEEMQKQLELILSERERMRGILSAAPFGYKIYPSEANFLLVDVCSANELYRYLIDKGVVVRNRNNVTLCNGCIRITIGTPEENDRLINNMKSYIA